MVTLGGNTPSVVRTYTVFTCIRSLALSKDGKAKVSPLSTLNNSNRSIVREIKKRFYLSYLQTKEYSAVAKPVLFKPLKYG